ncbi:MAG TPA: hypothetical protein VJM75_00980 [Acidimicrobiales bacterium]|nr:hypothetical protein [Acidimicrobiales bacterium]
MEEARPQATNRAPLPFDRWLATLVDMEIAALSVAPGGGRPRA